MTVDRGRGGQWALILGASSGFGEATAVELARHGFDIFGVHLDRRATMPNVERIVGQIRSIGREAMFFNVNAADDERRAEVLGQIEERARASGDLSPVRVLLHSLAFGTLRPYSTESPKDGLTRAQLEMTLDVMANSLVYWTQDVVRRKLLASGGRIFAMTSSGSTRVISSYGAVSAAKCALESHVRQLAYELSPMGIAVNAIRAGVTDTPSLQKIPGSDQLLREARRRHPDGRITVPTDVAKAIAALSGEGGTWMTGNVINVDGGEEVFA